MPVKNGRRQLESDYWIIIVIRTKMIAPFSGILVMFHECFRMICNGFKGYRQIGAYYIQWNPREITIV